MIGMAVVRCTRGTSRRRGASVSHWMRAPKPRPDTPRPGHRMSVGRLTMHRCDKQRRRILQPRAPWVRQVAPAAHPTLQACAFPTWIQRRRQSMTGVIPTVSLRGVQGVLFVIPRGQQGECVLLVKRPRQLAVGGTTLGSGAKPGAARRPADGRDSRKQTPMSNPPRSSCAWIARRTLPGASNFCRVSLMTC